MFNIIFQFFKKMGFFKVANSGLHSRPCMKPSRLNDAFVTQFVASIHQIHRKHLLTYLDYDSDMIARLILLSYKSGFLNSFTPYSLQGNNVIHIPNDFETAANGAEG